MKTSITKHYEITIIPTIKIFRGGFKKKHRKYGPMNYYLEFNWLKRSLTFSISFK